MKTKFLSLIFLMFFATSCGGDDNGPGTPPTSNPSNLNVTYNIVGNEDNLILGNGSGIVEFDAKATNAESYVLEYKGSSFDMVNGKLDLTIEESGAVTVQIKAIGSSGTSISKTESFDIVVEKEMPDELLQFLTADGSQKWRIIILIIAGISSPLRFLMLFQTFLWIYTSKHGMRILIYGNT